MTRTPFTLIFKAAIAVLLATAVFATPLLAAETGVYADGWAVDNNANWTPFPPSTNPLGVPNSLCVGSVSGVTAWAEFDFPTIDIPDTDVVQGIEVEWKYHTPSDQPMQLKIGGSNKGDPRNLPAETGTSTCDATEFGSAGGPTELWGTTWSVADVESATFQVRINKNTSPIDFDSVQLIVHHGPANTAPVANDDSYPGATEDTQLVVGAPGVLGNDTDNEGDALTAVLDGTTSNGTLSLAADGSFTYDPDENYCGPDSFTYHANDGALDSNVATVSISVACVNDAPEADHDAYNATEDTQLVVAAPGVLANDTDVEGDPLTAVLDSTTAHGTLALDTDGSFTYDPNLNYCGPDSFTYRANDGALDSNLATASISVACVNDPPTVTDVSPAAQTVDYSDAIATVTITVEDVDDMSTTLAESNEPPASAAGLTLAAAGCVTIGTESPDEDASTCTWTYDGQVIDPGDNVYAIVFTPSDADGAGTVTGTHTLTVEPEDATVMLDPGNDVAVEVATEGGDSGLFSLFFAAWETNDPDFPHGGTALAGDLNNMVPYMTLIPVGPGSPEDGTCAFTGTLPVPADGYDQVAYFKCDFDEVPVNLYEAVAAVDGASATTRYYVGSDEDVLVVFDPSLGFTTGGGWFYWPGTADPGLAACGPDGYAGDKTNFGFGFKYNKHPKPKDDMLRKPKGNLLLMRHTVDDDCLDAGSYKVKSNALDGMAIGEGTDGAGNYGWAAILGKATLREPNDDQTGGNPFIAYVEDHGEQGCNQDPSDTFWIEVSDQDGVVLLQLNGPDPVSNDPTPGADGDDEPIECGNIVVPHKTGKKE